MLVPARASHGEGKSRPRTVAKKDFFFILRTAGSRKNNQKRQMSSSRTRSTWKGRNIPVTHAGDRRPAHEPNGRSP